VFEGFTRFGFFPEASLAQQAGLRETPELPVPHEPLARRVCETNSREAEGGANAKTERFSREARDEGSGPAPAGPVPSHALPRTAPFLPHEAGPIGDPRRDATLVALPPAGPGLHAPASAWQLLDRIEHLSETEAVATLDVDPSAWFFEAHFFQDPVMPGSLGVEAFLQLVQAWARARFPHLAATHRFELGARRHAWTYRGQVRPHTKQVRVLARIREVTESPSVIADGFLLADGLPIYSMRDYELRLVPAEER
jgi:3-hydroxymyristoyl/3-hydroxydecanoyl-(acyl carrier protein) dehydratase